MITSGGDSCSVKGRAPGQGGASAGEQRRPLALKIAEWAGVVDVDACMDPRQFSSAEKALEVIVIKTAGECLPAGDDSVLSAQVSGEVHDADLTKVGLRRAEARSLACGQVESGVVGDNSRHLMPAIDPDESASLAGCTRCDFEVPSCLTEVPATSTW